MRGWSRAGHLHVMSWYTLLCSTLPAASTTRAKRVHGGVASSGDMVRILSCWTTAALHPRAGRWFCRRACPWAPVCCARLSAEFALAPCGWRASQTAPLPPVPWPAACRAPGPAAGVHGARNSSASGRPPPVSLCVCLRARAGDQALSTWRMVSFFKTRGRLPSADVADLY
jgi:hypothetical protein